MIVLVVRPRSDRGFAERRRSPATPVGNDDPTVAGSTSRSASAVELRN